MDKKVKVGELDSRTMLYGEMKTKGGDPSFVFELLRGIIDRREWDNLLDKNGNPVGSLRRLITEPLPTGIGQSVEQIRALLKVKHRHGDFKDEWLNKLRDDFENILEGETAESIPHGGDRRSEDFNIIYNDEKIERQGDGREYLISRLKRDAPDIAQQVINQEISAQEGKRRYYDRVGIRKRRVTIQNIYDAEQVVRWLEQCELTQDELLDIRDGIDQLLGD